MRDWAYPHNFFPDDVSRAGVITDRITKPLGVCFDFAAVFNLIFDYPNFGEWVPLGDQRWYRWVGSW